MIGHDLIVVGAGIVGTACADYASAEGLRVAIVEPGPIGGGVTAAGMGHLVAMDESPAQLALSTYSLRLWEDLRDLPQSEFSRCGTLWVARNEADWARIPPRQAALEAAGVEVERVDADALHELEPALAPGLIGGLRVPREAIVYPPAVARQLLARACGRGAVLHRARALELGDHSVLLDDGRRLHGPVLVATGCGLPHLLPELPLRLRKGHLVITRRCPGTIRHQLVELAYADSVHAGSGSSVAFNVQPRPTGQILIGSSREDGDDDPAVSLPALRRMLARSFAYLPGLRRLDALRVWTGQRPASVDGLPYLGPVPGRRGIWVAAGHEGLGVTTAPGSARLLVDWLLDRKPAIEAQAYAPARVLQ